MEDKKRKEELHKKAIKNARKVLKILKQKKDN